MRHCCLYTDPANPTTNGIRQCAGDRPLCDVSEYTFVRRVHKD